MTSLEFWEKLRNSDYAYTVSSKKRIVESNDDVKNFKTTLDDFRKSIKSLKKYTSGVTSRQRLEKQLSDFVKSYNNVKKKSGSITDKELKSDLDKLDSLINDNKKFFKKIGITQNEKGKFEFDTEGFDDIDTKDIDTLLVGRTSFISQANKILGNIEKEADAAEYSTTIKNVSYTKKYDKNFLEEIRMVQLCASDLSNIAKKAKDDKTVIENEKENIIGTAGYFDDMFRMLGTAIKSTYETEGLDDIKKLLEDNEILDKLNKIGIEPMYDDNHNFTQFSYDFNHLEDCFNTNDFYAAFESLFGENNTFANTIIEGCKKAFVDVVDPESLGVNVIDQRA